jgi:hypothetical protein
MPRITFLTLPLLLGLAVFAFAPGPAFSLEPGDGGIVEGDQDPEFNEPGTFDAIDEVQDLLEIEADEEEEPSDVVKTGVIVGIWQYTSRTEGRFHGKLLVRRPAGFVLVGRVKGLFKKETDGSRNMVGVVLNRKGTYKGTLRGTYDLRGFRAVWRAGQDRKGIAKARFVVPYGRAGFLGTFTVRDLTQD